MVRDRPGPEADRLIVARLAGTATRYARWGAMTEAGRAAGAAELQEIAGGRGDLLAELAGISLGTAESKGPEYQAKAEAIAVLRIAAGAHVDQVPQWVDEGRRRTQAARMPPFSYRHL
jgi:hypothetical protein